MKLTAKCYTIEQGKIVEGTLEDFRQFIETTTRPHGVDYKYYKQKVDKEGWAVAQWVTWAGPEHIGHIRFETEAEADEYLEDLYCEQILANSEFSIYLTRDEAEEMLAALEEE